MLLSSDKSNAVSRHSAKSSSSQAHLPARVCFMFGRLPVSRKRSKSELGGSSRPNWRRFPNWNCFRKRNAPGGPCAYCSLLSRYLRKTSGLLLVFAVFVIVPSKKNQAAFTNRFAFNNRTSQPIPQFMARDTQPVKRWLCFFFTWTFCGLHVDCSCVMTLT